MNKKLLAKICLAYKIPVRIDYHDAQYKNNDYTGFIHSMNDVALFAGPDSSYHEWCFHWDWSFDIITEFDHVWETELALLVLEDIHE